MTSPKVPHQMMKRQVIIATMIRYKSHNSKWVWMILQNRNWDIHNEKVWTWVPNLRLRTLLASSQMREMPLSTSKTMASMKWAPYQQQVQTANRSYLPNMKNLPVLLYLLEPRWWTISLAKDINFMPTSNPSPFKSTYIIYFVIAIQISFKKCFEVHFVSESWKMI